MTMIWALVLAVLASAPAWAQQAMGGDANVATWGNILWIVLVVGAAVGFIAIAMAGLRSSSKTRE